MTLTTPVTAVPPVVATREKVAVFSVELVIASENVADTEEFVATPIAAFAGDVVDTVGGVLSALAPVVKLQVKLAASALPARSRAPVVIVAVYCVLAARLDEGTNIALSLSTTTTPTTAAPPAVGAREKLEVLSVEAVIASEKVADIDEFRATLVAVFDGDVSEIVGGIVSAVPPAAGALPEVPTASDDELLPSAPPPPPPHPKRFALAIRAIRNNMLPGFLNLMFLSFTIREAKTSAIHMPAGRLN